MLPGMMQHWGHPNSEFSLNLTTDAKNENFSGTTKIRSSEILRDEYKIFLREHPRTSLAPGIQQPLHATGMPIRMHVCSLFLYFYITKGGPCLAAPYWSIQGFSLY